MKGTLLLLLLLLLLPARALAEEPADVSMEDGVAAWMETVDWSGMEALLYKLPEEARRVWGDTTVRERAEELALSGTDTGGASLKELLKGLLRQEGDRLAGTAATLTGLALVGALAGALSDGKAGGAGEAAMFVCRCFTLTAALSALASGAKTAGECVNGLCGCMELAAPVLTALLTALGAVSTVGVFQPAMALLTDGVAGAMRGVVTPLALCGGVVGLFDQLSERVRLTELSACIRGGIKWTIGLTTTLYAGITALFGVTAAARDGVAIRTAKYAAGRALPAVSGLVTGSFDTVVGCAGLVKNAVGTVLILLGAAAVLSPLVRLLVTVLMLRLTAAVTEPVAEKRHTGMLKAGADALSVLLSACAAVSAMFLMTLGLVVGLGSGGYAG